MFTRTAPIDLPRPRQNSRYAACAVGFISARAAIIRYRRRKRTQTAKRARFGLASNTCSALNKPLRVVGSYGRSALLGRRPKSASRTSPTTSAVLSRWSEWPPHDGVVCPVRIKRDADRVNARFRGKSTVKTSVTPHRRDLQQQNHHCSRCPSIEKEVADFI